MNGQVNHKDIQAIFRGFDRRWPLGRFYYLRYESSSSGHKVLQWLRDQCGGKLTSYADLEVFPDVCVNAAFTYWGLSVLGLTPEVLQSFPGDFRQGMVRRAELLGDMDESAPENWEELWRDGKSIHLWIGVYARSEEKLKEWDDGLKAAIDRFADHYARNEVTFESVDQPEVRFSSFMRDVRRVDVDPQADGSSKPPVTLLGTQDVNRFWANPDVPMHIDDPSTNPEKPMVMEHFGFRDGVSQPAIRSLEENRQIERNEVAGGGKLMPGKGVWEPLATGEFILGYVDEMGQIPISPVPPTLAVNGSFMVQRKLAQDVDGFRSYLQGAANEVNNRDGEPVTADYLAEKMMGRRRNGKPFADTESLNDFRYADDLEGRKCPMGSHMRRANPRDAMVQDKKVAHRFGSLLANRHRILRRAITYGDPVPHGVSMHDVNKDGQGLMFITLQSSIAGQYEFVQQQWLNFGNDLNQGNDRDPIVGNQEGQGRMTIPGDGVNPTMVCSNLPRFVVTRGGQYFFLPGVNAFNLLAGERYTQINTEE